MSASIDRLVIGTRGSALAVCQSGMVRDEIARDLPGTEVVLETIKTTGDKITDVPLAQVGGKGLFVKEIEEALLDGRVALAVHSMKDVPTQFPAGLHLGAITRREDPRDAVFTRNGKGLLDLPSGSRIGTSSLRRQSQIKHHRPDFEVVSLRGNLDTRIRKLQTEGLDAVIVASAGVRRMGWQDRITECLPPEICLPAIGQGALGLECRKDDPSVNSILSRYDHPETSCCVRAERALLKRLEGGCQVPIAAYARIENGEILLEGLVASLDGGRLIRERISGDTGESERLGVELAETLLSKGADDILREIYP
ncbi:MAG TPA: hydroxymethylbilane synthase [Nitrospiria bacterium]